MANLLSLLLFSFLFQPPTDHHVRGTVSDNLTGDGVTALMTLMTADSAVIDTVTATLYHNRFTGGTGASFAFRKAVSQKGRYLVKAEKAGYVARCVSFTIVSNRERDVSLTDIALQRAWRELPEVTVRATKVKMVVHGDTIVYNADAFNLAEGSMLDALVARLPGVRLTKEAGSMSTDAMWRACWSTATTSFRATRSSPCRTCPPTRCARSRCTTRLARRRA